MFPRGDRFRWVAHTRRAIVVGVTVCALGLDAGATEGSDCRPTSVVSASLAKLAAKIGLSGRKSGEISEPKNGRGGKVERHRRPMSEREIEALIPALELASTGSPEGVEINRRLESAGLSAKRALVLAEDATAILFAIHANETLARLASAEVSPQTREWMQRSLRQVLDCAPRRFQDRGDPELYERSRAIVEKHRAALVRPLLSSHAVDPVDRIATPVGVQSGDMQR